MKQYNIQTLDEDGDNYDTYSALNTDEPHSDSQKNDESASSSEDSGISSLMTQLDKSDHTKNKTKVHKDVVMNPVDAFTFANILEVQQQHVSLDLEVDFNKSLIHGQVEHLMKVSSNLSSPSNNTANKHLK